MKKLVAAGLVFLFSSSAANAEFIEAPAYPKGQAQVNDTLSFLHSAEDGVANSVEFTYGVTDWLAVVAAFDQTGGEAQNFDYYSNGEYTLQFDLLKETDDLPGTALRLTYLQNTGSEFPDTLETMAVFEKKFGNFDSFLNIAAGKTIGDAATGGLESGVAAQVMYGLNDYTNNNEWSIGPEYFGEYGKTGLLQGFSGKGQQIGPIISFQPVNDLQFSLNYLVGLDHNAQRSTTTFEVNFTF